MVDRLLFLSFGFIYAAKNSVGLNGKKLLIFPWDEADLFGLSPAFGLRFDDLPDWSLRPLPARLNAIVIYLALSQREGSKLVILERYLYFFSTHQNGI